MAAVTVTRSTPAVYVNRYDSTIRVQAAGPQGPAGAGASNTYTIPQTDAAIAAAVTVHATSTTPHNEATSGRDFAALFQNGLI